MSKRYEKAVNSFRLACGTASRCASCQALLAYGVNSTETMKAAAALVGHPVYGQGYVKWLRAHAAYHERLGEELPEEWTEAGLSDEFKANLMPLPHKPVFVRPVKPPFVRKDNDMDKAVRSFRKGRQENARTRPEPISKLDASVLRW